MAPHDESMNSNRFLLSLFFFLLLVWLNQVRAQTSCLVKHFTKQDYHAGSQNWSIQADDLGFVYVGNNDGLVIYDGTNWKTFRNADQTIL